MLFELLTLVIMVKSTADADLYLGLAALEVHGEGNEREALALHQLLDLADLLLVEQEFAVAVRLVAGVPGAGVRGDVRVLQPDFAVLDARIRALDLDAVFAHGLDLGASQGDARLELREELVVVPGTAVLGNR